jgi:hypothetical protein
MGRGHRKALQRAQPASQRKPVGLEGRAWAVATARLSAERSLRHTGTGEKGWKESVGRGHRKRLCD